MVLNKVHLSALVAKCLLFYSIDMNYSCVVWCVDMSLFSATQHVFSEVF